MAKITNNYNIWRVLMLKNNITTWIIHNVSGYYRQAELEVSLQAFDQFLEMDNELPSIYGVIEDMAQASDMEKVNFLKNFTNIERFTKMLFRLINPERMKEPPKPLIPNDKSTTWTLGNMYKEAFSIVDFSFNLTEAGKKLEQYNTSPNYLYHYLWIYKFRNDDIHDILALPLDVVQTAIRSILIVELDLCYRYRKVIADKYKAMKRKELFPGKEFTAKIQNDYREFEKNGFGYVDIHWISSEDKDKIDCSVEKLATMKDWTVIKILGEAGSGKSTALKRIEYILAGRYQKNSNTVLPIYIELYTLTDGDQILLDKIAGTMNIESTLAEEFLANGEICLLLDGFNEILDTPIKKKVAKELDAFSRNYPQTRIFLTDRAISSASIPTLNVAKRMHLRPITMEDRKNYFEKNCNDSACLELILKKMNEQPEYFELMNTPLKLKQLSEVAKYRMEIPNDITDEYIKYLMDREENEKKDENIEYLPTFLQALAIMDEEEIPMLMANAQMAKCKTVLGFSIPDTNQCLKLAIDMGILACEENNMVRFASTEYRDYFLMEGLGNQLDVLIQ